MPKFFSIVIVGFALLLRCEDGTAAAYFDKNKAISIFVSNENDYQASKAIVPSDANPDPNSISLLMSEQRGDRNQLLPLKSPVAQLLEYLEDAIRRKFSIKYYPWKRVLHSGETGEGIIFGIYKNKEREQIFNFSEPVYSDYVYLVTRCDKPVTYRTIADLKDKVIGLSLGASAGPEFDRELGLSIKPEYNSSSMLGQFSKLYQKRVDAFLYFEFRNDIEHMQKEINQRYAGDLPEYKERKLDIFCIVPKPLLNSEVYFAISKRQDKTVLSEISKILLQARRNGDLERIFSGH